MLSKVIISTPRNDRFWCGNRKPAREFTAVERGHVKYNYHCRKVVWDKIAELVRAGWTSDMAIDAISNAYWCMVDTYLWHRLSMQCGGIRSMEGIPHFRFKLVDMPYHYWHMILEKHALGLNQSYSHCGIPQVSWHAGFKLVDIRNYQLTCPCWRTIWNLHVERHRWNILHIPSVV